MEEAKEHPLMELAKIKGRRGGYSLHKNEDSSCEEAVQLLTEERPGPSRSSPQTRSEMKGILGGYAFYSTQSGEVVHLKPPHYKESPLPSRSIPPSPRHTAKIQAAVAVASRYTRKDVKCVGFAVVFLMWIVVLYIAFKIIQIYFEAKST